MVKIAPLRPISVVHVPAKKELDDGFGLPNEENGSDHLPLVSKFVWV
jgi:hypothetical protein